MGLVVTLEPFHLVNTLFYDGVFNRGSTPCTVASAHDLEGTVARLQAAPDVGQRLHAALTSNNGEVASLRKAGEDLPEARNPILGEAWQRFSNT